MKDSQPQRKYPAHPSPVRRHNEPVILLVTVCTVNRAAILATPEAHAGLVSVWSRAAHWLVGYYLTMPDHVHLFCAPGIHTPP